MQQMAGTALGVPFQIDVIPSYQQLYLKLSGKTYVRNLGKAYFVTRKVVDCVFKNSDVMGLIFDYLTLLEAVYLQRLNRRMYYVKVPTFVQTFYLPSFKLLPKHEFINTVRTMNVATHQFRSSEYIFNGVKGDLCGEFRINDIEPDGRFRFLSRDRNIRVLCYFKNGVLQKGPRLYCDFSSKVIKLNSKT